MKTNPFENRTTHRISEPKAHFRDHRSHKIPKIFDKQIPLHHLGITLEQFSLPKDIRARSKIWLFQNRREMKSSEPEQRKNYNRPVNLLKGYLQRKEKYAYQPVLTNPEIENHPSQHEQQNKQFSRTFNDFRIKKGLKRSLQMQPHLDQKQNEESMQTTQLQKTDKDLSTFNSKNLYDMTLEELQESIEWKKRFLELITRKHNRMDKPRNISYLNQF